MRAFRGLSLAALVAAAATFLSHAASAQDQTCTFKQGNLSVKSYQSNGRKVIEIARACDKSKYAVGPTTYWSRL